MEWSLVSVFQFLHALNYWQHLRNFGLSSLYLHFSSPFQFSENSKGWTFLLMGMGETLIIVDDLFSLFLYLNCHTDLIKTKGVVHSDTPARCKRGGIKMSWYPTLHPNLTWSNLRCHVYITMGGRCGVASPHKICKKQIVCPQCRASSI